MLEFQVIGSIGCGRGLRKTDAKKNSPHGERNGLGCVVFHESPRFLVSTDVESPETFRSLPRSSRLL
jgi:hypothetical protein